MDWHSQGEIAEAMASMDDSKILVKQFTINPQRLPSVRQISLELFQNPSEQNPSGVAEMAAYWMYFIGSDLANIAPNQCLIKG